MGYLDTKVSMAGCNGSAPLRFKLTDFKTQVVVCEPANTQVNECQHASVSFSSHFHLFCFFFFLSFSIVDFG